MKNTIKERTLASIVTEKPQAAAILEKYNLDFCCKGKRTLAEACMEKGLVLETVFQNLLQAGDRVPVTKMPFSEMTAEQLVSYILIHHHFYVKQALPTISNHLEKVVSKHGLHFPYMAEVQSLFHEIKEEMIMHMQKEEVVLFPRIKRIAMLSELQQYTELDAAYISMPVEMMEEEHDHAGAIMYQIRSLTNNYAIPENACTTFRVCLGELKEFEEDLHQHVHLENNILFPLAKNIVAGIRAKAN